MVVTEEDFKRIEIGTIMWQCYYDSGYPHIGKTFVKGKKLHDNGTYSVSLVKDYGRSANTFASRKKALNYYKQELAKIKKKVEASLKYVNDLVDSADTDFDKMSKESEKEITNKADHSMFIMGLSEDDEEKEVTVNTDNIPEIKFEVGDTVWTALSLSASDIYGQSPGNYTIVEDIITEVEVNFRNTDDIYIEYSTKYCSNNYMRGQDFHKTKEGAVEYCRKNAQKVIDYYVEKMENIEYRTSDHKNERLL